MSPLLLALLVGCGPEPRTLTVLAASSLGPAFDVLEVRFEAEHPGVDVVVSTAGSQTLATQIRQGIAADVFASADRDTLEALVREGRIAQPTVLARNALVLGVSTGIPEDVTLDTLPELDRLVLAAPEVPLGRYTDALLEDAARSRGPDWARDVRSRVVSREPSARMVASKVALGEADAAIVYRTDALQLEGIRVVPLPGDGTACFHGALTDAPEPELASSWIAMVGSGVGQAVLAEHGFVVDR